QPDDTIRSRVLFGAATRGSMGCPSAAPDGPVASPSNQDWCPVQPMFEALSSDVARQDQEVVELPLLLPRWQALELEAAARRRGMTTGQMIRRVIGDALAGRSRME